MFLPQAVQLEVGDNGQGFDLPHILGQRDGHLGIIGMNERAQNMGGSLLIETRPEIGTRVILEVPLLNGLETPIPAHKERRNGQAQPANSHSRR